MRRSAAALLLLALAGGAAGADRVHVVEPGETLWQITDALIGEPERWPELYRANRDQIKDPSTLYPGQRLAVPDFGEPSAPAPSGGEGAEGPEARLESP